MNREDLREYASDDINSRDFSLADLGGIQASIPGLPVSSNIQVIIFIGLGWLFSLVAAKYGLNPTDLQNVITNTDQETHTQITNAVANYEKYRAAIVGALLIVVNGGNIFAASKIASSNTKMAEANSRAMVSRNLVMEAQQQARSRSLELEIEKMKIEIPAQLNLPSQSEMPPSQ